MTGMLDHSFGCQCRRHTARPWHRAEHWTRIEVFYLEGAYGRVSDQRIAVKLGRPVVGIRLKAKRLGLRKRDAGLTASEVARQLGVDPTTVLKRWIRFGLLRSHRGFLQGPHRVRMVSEEAVRRFIIAHGEQIDWDKVPAESPFHELVMAHRWFGKDQLHRLTGRLNIDDELRAGIIRARQRGGRAGSHWYVPESELPKIRRLLPEHIEESVWRREQVLRVRRERRRRQTAAVPA